jgi:hypothetical protein
LKKKTYVSFHAKSVTGPAIYYMGIVDFLQDWTTRKKTERMIKMYCLGQEAEGISVNHPDPYKVRFQNKMDEIFDLEGHQNRKQHLLEKANKTFTARMSAPGAASNRNSGDRPKSNNSRLDGASEPVKSNVPFSGPEVSSKPPLRAPEVGGKGAYDDFLLFSSGNDGKSNDTGDLTEV